MPENSAVQEAVRLLIWDLDDTFWSGTLSEGGATLLMRNVEMVRTLSQRGILNSICSKNDRDKACAVLSECGIWDYFVFPQIAWEAKGAMVRSIVESSQLRPESVMFVDDNPINLNEVRHYNPGVQLGGPQDLETLLDDPRFKGKDDRELSRLRQYKLIEGRESQRRQSSDNNTEFLRQSEIQLSFHHDVMEEFDRIHELINRTNQLNFTKIRLPEDPVAARAELEAPFRVEHDRHAGYIKVSDKYGYYGIVGFYVVKLNVLKQFSFSCRILNMGVEQFVYQKLGRPGLKVVGEVVSDPLKIEGVDWIKVVDDAENRVGGVSRSSLKITVRGGCELVQSTHYLRQRFDIVEEFPFPHRGWGISVPLVQYAAFREGLADAGNAELLKSFPGIRNICVDNSLFSASSDVYVLSFGIEKNVGNYRYKPTGQILPILLGQGTATLDLTTLSHEKIKTMSRLDCDERWWAWFCANFQLVDRFDAERFRANLSKVFAFLKGKRVMVIKLNTRHGKFLGMNKANAEINAVVEQTVGSLISRSIELDEMIHGDDDVIGMNHFRREVYMRLSDLIRDELETTGGSTIRPSA